MDQLGGYRIVRRIGEGPRAEVLLARSEGETESAASVAIKHCREGVDDASISIELEALARAAGDHSVELLDVATAPGGALALVLGRLDGGSLGRLLGIRPTLALGELPTILAPLGALIDRLHAAGVAHRGIRLESVLFDSAGAPVLACFGRAELMQPGLTPAGLEAAAGALADQRALISIALTVLDRAEDQQAVMVMSEWLVTGGDAYRVGWGEELAELALHLATPVPIDFRPSSLPIDVRVPARLPMQPAAVPLRRSVQRSETVHQRVAPPTARPRRDDRRRESRSVAKPALEAAGAPEWLTALIPAELVARARASLSAVRAPVWVIAALVGAGLVAALILVPQGGSGAAADPERPGPGITAEPSPHPGETTRPSALPVQSDPLAGDDPVTAVVALLESRERCIADRSVLCLDSVAQSGSSALADDQLLVRSLQDGAETPEPFVMDVGEVTLVERLGDTALLELDGVADTQPASILLMRTEAGWRIRDYLER